MKPLWKVINIYMCAYTYIYTYCICIVCFFRLIRTRQMVNYAWEAQRQGKPWLSRATDVHIVRQIRRKERISQLVPSSVSLRMTGAWQLHQVKRMIGGIGDMWFSICSQTWKWERSKSFFGELLKHVITRRGQILVSRTDDDHRLPPVCPFKTSPCVLAPCAHVFQHVRVVPVHTGTFWTYTQGTFWTDTRDTPTTTTTHTTDTTCIPTHNITHNITRRQRRQRQRKKTERERRVDERRKTRRKRREDRERERRQGKTREDEREDERHDKRRDEKTWRKRRENKTRRERMKEKMTKMNEKRREMQ